MEFMLFYIKLFLLYKIEYFFMYLFPLCNILRDNLQGHQ